MDPAELKAFKELDARGLALLDYWRQYLPSDYTRLKREGRIYRFIHGQQESYHEMADRLKNCNMPVVRKYSVEVGLSATRNSLAGTRDSD